MGHAFREGDPVQLRVRDELPILKKKKQRQQSICDESSPSPKSDSASSARKMTTEMKSLDFNQCRLSSLLSVPLSITKWMGQSLLRHQKPKTRYPDDFENYFNELLPSVDEPLCEFSAEVPELFDVEKFARGKAFARKHILGLLYAEELSLVLMLPLRILRDPLVFSGRSDTPHKAFCRYLSTVERVMSWYTDDIWDKASLGHQNLMTVRGMHHRVDRDMQISTAAQREKKIPSYESTRPEVLQKLWADLEAYLPDAEHKKWLERFQPKNGLFINQAGMTLTQVGFVALLILEPGKFGVLRVTEAELDDFVYVWYVIGRQLGIADRYNLCTGGLELTRWRCKLLIRHLLLPSLATAGPDWEHMSRCIVAAIHRMVRQPPFTAALSYCLDVLDVPTPHLDSLIPWRTHFHKWLFRCLLCIFISVPGIQTLCAKALKFRLGNLRRRLDNNEISVKALADEHPRPKVPSLLF